MKPSNMWHWVAACFLGMAASAGGLLGCSGEEKNAETKILTTSENSAVSFATSSVDRLLSPELYQEFEPFPDWRVGEETYRLSRFSVLYLTYQSAVWRDKNKSLVAVLYRDTKNADKYRMRYSIRTRHSKTSAWEELDCGLIEFILRGENVQLVTLAKENHSETTIDISVRKNSESKRYFNIKVAYHDWHDEIHYSIREENDPWQGQ